MRPRVWFDILTPKQVLFFAPIVADLVSQGSEALATSRKYREIEPAAKMCGLDLKFVGERGGKDPSEQLLASARRESEVIPMVKEFAPDVTLSVASAVCARVAFGLRVPHIAVNDSPHSEVAGRLSLPLSVLLLCPWIIPYNAWTRYGLTRSQILRYHALDPVAWLRRKPLNGPVPRLSAGKKTITVRLEESYAPYMAGSNERWGEVVLKSIAEAFPDHNLVVLCRYGNQLEEVREKVGSQYIIPENFVDGRRLLSSTDLFIGMGGTMSAEAALMGVPTISAFQGSLLTEKYLISVGLLSKVKNSSSLVQHARQFLDPSFKDAYSKRARRIFSGMEDPVPKIVSSVLKVAAQA